MAMKALMLGAAVSLALTGTALAGQDKHGWYIAAAGGANWAEIEDWDDLDTGWAAAASVGYAFEKPFRLELELSGRWDDGETQVIDPSVITAVVLVPAELDSEVYAAMLNAVVDIDLGGSLTLSLGGGAGYAMGNADLTIFTTPALVGEADEEGFAYQGLAELALDVGQQTELFAGYRYFVFDDYDYEAHTALLGLRYFFAAPVAPVAEPAPAPAEPAPARTFIVFFDFNKSNLTAEAQAVVAEASEAFKAGANVVLVVGHTDTVGSAGYNQKLSERRAASVKAEMVRLGVPSDVITTEGRGFSEPLVPTGPGVKEPQNRRAVIELQ